MGAISIGAIYVETATQFNMPLATVQTTVSRDVRYVNGASKS